MEQQSSSRGLQFRRNPRSSSAVAISPPEVDWEEVEQTLAEVDPEGIFSDPRFDPLKHALGLLGSVTAEKELDEVCLPVFLSLCLSTNIPHLSTAPHPSPPNTQLREHWLAIDNLVDSAVEAHYSGFNKSLQNYSQILRLFSESRAQLAVLRRGLEQAQVRLQPRPSRLKELYRKDLMLADVRRLLEDAQAAVAVPKNVQRLIDRSVRWFSFVLFYSHSQ